MRIIKTGIGNINEAFVEDRLTTGVNVIFSNDNNKGKTIIFQGLMYALGNEPIFPSGFDYKTYYFYTSIESNGVIYEFLRHNNTTLVKVVEEVSIHVDASSLKEYIRDNNVFTIPVIQKDGFDKLVDLPLLFELFFIGQDKRNPSNIINSGYYTKQDFANMVYALAGCASSSDSLEKLKNLKEELRKCKEEISRLEARLAFYREHPEVASVVSRSADKQFYENERQELQTAMDAITTLQKKRTRLLNRKTKLESLLQELKSLNMQLKCGEIQCYDCGSKNISYIGGDFSFELTNDLVRRNIIESIKKQIYSFIQQIAELENIVAAKQQELNGRLRKSPPELVDILTCREIIRTYDEDEARLIQLYGEKERLETSIKFHQKQQDDDLKKQGETKKRILDTMNALYKAIDPDGTQEYKDFFTTKNMTFSGSEEQEYYFARAVALFKNLRFNYPIIMDCFRKGELSSKKERLMIDAYKNTGLQVILSATLKDEEYSSETKHYEIEGVNAIDYEVNPNSHILQPQHAAGFMTLVKSFGVMI